MLTKKYCLGLVDTDRINDSDDKIADNKQDVRKVVACEALESLDVVNFLVKFMAIADENYAK